MDGNSERDSISAVLIVRNEERNLPVALRSVAGWTREIVVVDMDSSDQTAEIARSFGARVFPHEPIGFADPARPFGVAQATSDWVVMLDADELVTPGLAEQILEKVRRADADAVWLPYANYLFGRRMAGSSWSYRRSRHLRLFRPAAVDLTGRVHDFLHPAIGARVGSIPYARGTCVVHFNYTTIDRFIEKTNRYTTIEAVQAREALKGAPGPIQMVGRPIAEFLNQWLLKGGYRDGWPGFYIAALMAFYRFAERAKLRELLENGDEAAVQEAYAALAEEWLSGRVPD